MSCTSATVTLPTIRLEIAHDDSGALPRSVPDITISSPTAASPKADDTPIRTLRNTRSPSSSPWALHPLSLTLGSLTNTMAS